MVVTRLPGHPLTAEVGDRCVLGPVEQLGGKPGLTPPLGQGISGEARGRGLAGEKVKHSSGEAIRSDHLSIGIRWVQNDSRAI